MIGSFPLVLSLSKDASQPEPGFDKLSLDGLERAA